VEVSSGRDVEGVPPRAEAPGFVALSRFTVVNGMTSEVKNAFIERPHRVDDVSGFLRMEVISPLDAPDEIWLLTYWRDEESFRVWHGSHLHQESHQGIPKGLKLDPRATRIRYFEHVCS
jgi:heme-degrading monooxygenase HmoA